MKLLTVLSASVLAIAVAGRAFAGVVVDEQQTVDKPGGGKITRTRVVMIQGNKQKSVIDDGSRTVITDLDRGVMTMVNSKQKSYVELPFPPRGPMAQMATGMPKMQFKKTGQVDKVIGYSCDVFTGSGKIGQNEVVVNGCFSSTAPGATDYTAFQKTMAQKVKGTSIGGMGEIPDGVPLSLEVTTKTGNISTGGMSADQAAKVHQMLSNRQFVTNTVVDKISTQDLPADSFTVPSDYTKQPLPSIFAGHGAPAMSGGEAPRKVPE